MSKGRRMRFTVNNWDEETKEKLLKEEKFSYIVLGEELAPTTGTPHLQGYAEFTGAYGFAQFAKKYGLHFETCQASSESNIEYCKKDGIFIERGTPKGGPAAGAKATKEKYAKIIKQAEEGKLEEIKEENPEIYLRCYTTLNKIKQSHMIALPQIDIENYWICGAPGVGKSKKAREMAGDTFYPKQLNKWWDGYLNEDWVIIDDWEIDCKLDHHLKIWADRYDFIGETKGGSLRIRPKHIVVTSNYTINDCFIERSLNEAISRRFKVISL